MHCFVYGGRTPQASLEQYCEKIYYYPRERSIKYLFSSLPFVVKSRMNTELLENLQVNNFPILFDATHTTGFLHHPKLNDRKKIVRLHNIEWIYYRILFDSAFSLKEKIFYFSEYKKLIQYDNMLTAANALSCLSETDFEYYTEKFPNTKISLEYVFHENEELTCKEGSGGYILYHGNLSLLDNHQLIFELLNNELKDCHYPIVLAGKDPPATLIELVRQRQNIRLIPNPSATEMHTLLQEAHICLAVAKNPSGVKLKLINALFATRFVISNECAVTGSGLEELCILPTKEKDYQYIIDELMQTSFDAAQIQRRKSVLEEKYNNKKNALQLLQLVSNNSQN